MADNTTILDCIETYMDDAEAAIKLKPRYKDFRLKLKSKRSLIYE